ncbi:MAG: cation transporter, partial [Proteobacteria bacterium]|nr:cation transporter [Pseudomonadota bacterium]
MEHTADSHGTVSYSAAFAIGIALNVIFIAAEIFYGFSSNSLSLVADAAHNVSDVAGLALAWGAAWLVTRAPTLRRTYGYRRSSILAAVANATLLLVAVGGILFESVQRLLHPQPTAALTVIVVAAFGVLINGVSALLFARGREHDLNIRGAFVHMAADAGISFGVICAAIIGRMTGLLWIDPAAGIAISLLVLFSAWGL